MFIHRAGTARIYACGHDVRRICCGKCANVVETRSLDGSWCFLCYYFSNKRSPDFSNKITSRGSSLKKNKALVYECVNFIYIEDIMKALKRIKEKGATNFSVTHLDAPNVPVLSYKIDSKETVVKFKHVMTVEKGDTDKIVIDYTKNIITLPKDINSF